MVLTACDDNPLYLNCIPCVFDCWKKLFNVSCKLILVSKTIPDILKDYKNDIELFVPIDGIHPAFTAQVVRILYPCLFSNNTVLITDADIVPCNKKYFDYDDFDDNMFVTFRDKYIKDNMLAMCYNMAKGQVWKEIFKINNTVDVRDRIKEWYNYEYTGIKNCPGWFTDQQKLFEYVKLFDQKRVKYLKDEELKFNRLDKKQKIYILTNFEIVKLNVETLKYTDFHLIRPFYKYEKLIKQIIEEIIKSN